MKKQSLPQLENLVSNYKREAELMDENLKNRKINLLVDFFNSLNLDPKNYSINTTYEQVVVNKTGEWGGFSTKNVFMCDPESDYITARYNDEVAQSFVKYGIIEEMAKLNKKHLEDKAFLLGKAEEFQTEYRDRLSAYLPKVSNQLMKPLVIEKERMLLDNNDGGIIIDKLEIVKVNTRTAHIRYTLSHTGKVEENKMFKLYFLDNTLINHVRNNLDTFLIQYPEFVD